MFTQNKTLGKCLLFSHFIGLFNRNSRKKGPRSRLQKTVQKSRYSTILQDFDNNTTTAIVLAFYTSQKRLLSFLTTPTYYLGGECYYSMPSCRKKWQYNGKHLGQTTNALTLQWVYDFLESNFSFFYQQNRILHRSKNEASR